MIEHRRIGHSLKLGLCAWLLAVGAAADSLETQIAQCDFEAGGVLSLDTFDLGQGMVSHLENRSRRGTDLVVTSCHTGKFLRARVLVGSGSSAREIPETLGVFEDFTGGRAVTSIGKLAEELEARAVPTTYGVNRREICACRLAYPGLRGTKLPYGE